MSNLPPPPEDPSWPARSRAVRRATFRLCIQLGWVGLHEMPLPNGRRVDIMALRPDGGFACIEVKSGARDFLTDVKWPGYREFSDALYFAVDSDFPRALLSDDVGLIVTAGTEAALIREAPEHRMAGVRRRGLLHRFAVLAAARLAILEDPVGAAALRNALRVE